MYIREAMHPGAEWITPDKTLEEAARKMRDLDVGCLPVGENDRLVGMITDRDIVCRGIAFGSDPKTAVKDVMSTGIVYCFEDEEIDDVAHFLEEKQLHRLVVLNRRKRMVGLLSLGDIATHCSHELTGEILDAVSQPTH
jgi:CBS domain-containing protein